MTDIPVVISIDRTSLGKAALVLSGTNDGTALGVTSFVPPGDVARITYMPDNPNIDGSEALSASSQQALLGFNAVPDNATDEATIAVAIAELKAALRQFSYLVTTTVGNAPAEVWSADRGSIGLANPEGRTYMDLLNSDPVYAVTIPVYPTPGSVT